MHTNPHDADVERRLERWAASHSGDVSAEVGRKVRDILPSSLDRVKPLPSQSLLASALFGVFAALALALMAVMDKAGFRLMSGVQMVGMATVLAGGGILFSIAISRRMVPGSRPGPPVLVLLAFVGLGVVGATALLFPWRIADAFVSEGWPCALMELVVVVPATVVFYFLARRGALFADAGLGAAFSGLVAVLALLVLQFRCMFQQAPHLLVWHEATAAVVIALGTIFGRWRRHRWIS
jgi:hypothetical protein